MVDFKELRKIINGSKMSVKHYADGSVAVTDSHNFRGMNISAMEEAQSLLEEALKNDTVSLAEKCGIKQIDTLQSVTERAQRNIGAVIDCALKKENVTAQDMHRTAIRDSIINGRWNVANEANALYSQKGLFETIVNKKSKAILLNGINLENSKLTQKQIDTVKEKMEIRNFKNILADSVTNSLVYGGALVFPMLKKDTPVTTSMTLNQLLRLGILKKDCIDYFVTLDRWQTFIIPPYNPTQKDFLRPEVYTVPFLGADVHHTRCARVVTAKQAGYWGQILNQGWGISDMCAYLQSGMNYKVAVQSLPLMIQQMSILARVINVDGVLATEGRNALEGLVDEGTVITREASPDNPITMDVLGDIKSINRNFGQVPELIRLLRQDVASDATLPEPLLWSSEKGNFSSGDDTQGNLFKQNESIQMIHKDLEPQFKQLAKIMIIDALGTSDEVLEALPYTTIHFDQPVIANALERAQIGKAYSETVFNLVSAQVPVNVAVEMADKNVSADMRTGADILEKLANIQTKNDKNDDKRVDLELKQKKADVEQTEAQTEATEESAKAQKAMVATEGKTKKHEETEEEKKTRGRSPAEETREKALSDKEEKSYSKLEQKQHERARQGSTRRSEKLAKARNKSV